MYIQEFWILQNQEKVQTNVAKTCSISEPTSLILIISRYESV